MCLCAYVPMCLCAYVPLCLCAGAYASVPMCLCASGAYVLVPPVVQASVPMCLCAYVPMCLCAYVPMCLCASGAYVLVPTPLCPCAYVPMCLWCLCAFVPMCLCAYPDAAVSSCKRTPQLIKLLTCCYRCTLQQTKPNDLQRVKLINSPHIDTRTSLIQSVAFAPHRTFDLMILPTAQ
jgi:hypothetical protein